MQGTIWPHRSIELRHPRHRTRFHQAAAGKAQLQAMQVELQAMAVHGRDG